MGFNQSVIAVEHPTAYIPYMPKLRHYDDLNTARFVTFSCYRRLQLLVQSQVIRVFLETVSAIRKEPQFRLLGYVIMPEHVHLVLHPIDGTKLGPLIGKIKSKAAARIITEGVIDLPDCCRITRNGIERRAFWQPRCYDHNCRSEATVMEKINYCHNNPVSRGLVAEPAAWRWSSYNWYAGERDVPLAIDELEGISNQQRREPT